MAEGWAVIKQDGQKESWRKIRRKSWGNEASYYGEIARNLWGSVLAQPHTQEEKRDELATPPRSGKFRQYAQKTTGNCSYTKDLKEKK